MALQAFQLRATVRLTWFDVRFTEDNLALFAPDRRRQRTRGRRLLSDLHPILSSVAPMYDAYRLD